MASMLIYNSVILDSHLKVTKLKSSNEKPTTPPAERPVPDRTDPGDRGDLPKDNRSQNATVRKTIAGILVSKGIL